MWDLLREGIRLKLFLGKMYVRYWYLNQVFGGDWHISPPKTDFLVFFLFKQNGLFTSFPMCWIQGDHMSCCPPPFTLFLTKITHSCMGILSINLEGKKNPTGGQQAFYGLVSALTPLINCMALGKSLASPGLSVVRYEMNK